MKVGREERPERNQLQGRPVLVTGGAGFIGANLVRMLVDHGCRVTVLDNLTTGRRDRLDGQPVEFVEGDILDRRLVEHLVPSHDFVVHLAAQSGVPTSLQDPRNDCRLNVIGTLNMLEACRAALEDEKQGAMARRELRFVLASSNAPLGRQPPPADESKAPLPISPYGASKLAAEAYCLAYHGSWNVGTVVLRFGNVYGPFSAHKTSVVAKFFKDIRTTGQVIIDGDGQQTRDFIYVGDLCRAILSALASNVSGEVFQIANGEETTIQELAETMSKVVGQALKLQHGPSRRGDIRKNYSVIEKARNLLGWEPQVDLLKGLTDTARWFEQQEADDSNEGG